MHHFILYICFPQNLAKIVWQIYEGVFENVGARVNNWDYKSCIIVNLIFILFVSLIKVVYILLCASEPPVCPCLVLRSELCSLINIQYNSIVCNS